MLKILNLFNWCNNVRYFFCLWQVIVFLHFWLSFKESFHAILNKFSPFYSSIDVFPIFWRQVIFPRFILIYKTFLLLIYIWLTIITYFFCICNIFLALNEYVCNSLPLQCVYKCRSIFFNIFYTLIEYVFIPLRLAKYTNHINGKFG